MSDDKSLDILGIKPIASAIDKTTEGVISGISAVLSRICLPVSEEIGLFLQDKIKSYRTKNAFNVVQTANNILNTESSSFNLKAHPYLVINILEKGSWFEDKELQKVWGGLLASSCSDTESDDSNLIFINLLSSLSIVQVRILNHACHNSIKRVGKSSLVTCDELYLNATDLLNIAGISDLYRLDRELDHLRSLELIDPRSGGFGFDEPSLTADVAPTGLAINLFVRCQGSRLSPFEFFNLSAEFASNNNEKLDAS